MKYYNSANAVEGQQGGRRVVSDMPIANPVVVFREEFDDWAVLFNPDTADAAGINPVGCEVWKLLDGRHTIEDIIVSIRDRFEDVPGTAADEIVSFIKELEQRGFVGYVQDQNSR